VIAPQKLSAALQLIDLEAPEQVILNKLSDMLDVPVFAIAVQQGLHVVYITVLQSDGRHLQGEIRLNKNGGMDRSATQQQQDQQVKVAKLSKLNILLVDDNSETLRILSGLLINLGHAVLTAGSVKEAIALAEHQDFDILLSDIGLPDGTGRQLLRLLKQKHSIIGIAVSAYGMPEDIEKNFDAGFVKHLTKPTSLNELCAAIASASQFQS
jgi:CheY-like chemotaxis protein